MWCRHVLRWAHADVSTTLQIYTHLDAIHKRKSVDKLDAYLSGNSKRKMSKRASQMQVKYCGMHW